MSVISVNTRETGKVCSTAQEVKVAIMLPNLYSRPPWNPWNRQPRLRLYVSGIGQLLQEVHSKHVYPCMSTQECAKSIQDLKNTFVLAH